MQCSWSFCYAEFRSALLPSICQLVADDNAFPWFVPSLTLLLSLALYLSHSPSVRLFSFLFAGFHPCPNPPLSLSLSSSLSSFCSHFPTSFARSPSSLCALRFSFMIVHRAQLRNGFIIELPSAMNLSLF